MAAIQDQPTSRTEPQLGPGGPRGGGDEAGDAMGIVEEAEQGRSFVKFAVAAEEGGICQEAAPGLAGEGGADEASWVVRREAEEDLRDDVIHERRRRHGRWCSSTSPEVGFAQGNLGKKSERGMREAERAMGPRPTELTTFCTVEIIVHCSSVKNHNLKNIFAHSTYNCVQLKYFSGFFTSIGKYSPEVIGVCREF